VVASNHSLERLDELEYVYVDVIENPHQLGIEQYHGLPRNRALRTAGPREEADLSATVRCVLTSSAIFLAEPIHT
jgi:hypothetical protein